MTLKSTDSKSKGVDKKSILICYIDKVFIVV